MGPSKEDKAAIRRTSDTQTRVANEQLNFARESRRESRDAMAPALDYYKSIVSGDRNAVLSAAAPSIAEITRASRVAKENAYSTMGPGAGRDFMLAQIDRETPSQISMFVNNQRNSAFDKLANLGAGVGAFSLQELGAGLRAGESAVGSRSNVMQADAAGKAATLGFLGNVAGAAGGAAGGYFMKPTG